jgi:hypothetical protein
MWQIHAHTVSLYLIILLLPNTGLNSKDGLSGGLVDVPTIMLSQSDRRTRGAHKFRQIQSNKDFYKFSFFPNTISVWNSLPQSIALSPNLESDWDSMVVGTSTKPLNLNSSIRLALVRLQARLSHCKVSMILVTAPGDLLR